MGMKVKDIDALREQISKDPRESFTKHQVWLFASEHNKTVPTVEAIPKEKMIEMYDKIVKTSYGTAEHYPKYKGIMLYEAQMIIDIMKEYLFKENEDATN